MHDIFRRFSNVASGWTGSVYAFAIALAIIFAWAITGPIFGFSDTWQLIINTGTTIVTFLMVFLIQNTQNRDNAALHAKLDELIVHTIGARNKLVAAEELTEEELSHLKEHFRQIARKGGTHDVDNGKPLTSATKNGNATAAKNGGAQSRRRKTSS
jgi:low affinity Fe/Cu permease